jgi:hypothetical protein
MQRLTPREYLRAVREFPVHTEANELIKEAVIDILNVMQEHAEEVRHNED